MTTARIVNVIMKITIKTALLLSMLVGATCAFFQKNDTREMKDEKKIKQLRGLQKEALGVLKELDPKVDLNELKSPIIKIPLGYTKKKVVFKATITNFLPHKVLNNSYYYTMEFSRSPQGKVALRTAKKFYIQPDLGEKNIDVFPAYKIVKVVNLLKEKNEKQVDKTIVLNYSDFGPQSRCYELIGMEWWQWDNHGDSRPRHYDIKVVVYRDIPLDQVKGKYPVIESKEQDYRYLEYNKAIRFLNDNIPKKWVDDNTDHLIDCKKKIISKLGK